MTTIPKVILVDPDPQRSASLRLGFSRRGFDVAEAAIGAVADDLDATARLVVVNADAVDDDLRMLGHACRRDGRNVPLLCLGKIDSGAACAVGVDEVIAPPAHLRDVILIGRLMQTQAGGALEHRGMWAGTLADTASVYYLVRALGAMKRSGVLTLGRGFRRGEVRFCEGEVTSVQVGGHHGQAALHQLLLWTDAKFDYRREDVVRRRQIPLDPDDLFADAERFLCSVRAASGGLSPAGIFEQDLIKLQTHARLIPGEVNGVLRLFDGHRALADILEDSPYRVFETLRVVHHAVEFGLLRLVHMARPTASWNPELELERWLVGAEPGATAGNGHAAAASGDAIPSTSGERASGSQGQSKKDKRGATPATGTRAVPLQTTPTIDWGALAPRAVGAEMIGLAGVVPAARIAGEITVASETKSADMSAKAPAVAREGLEALTDVGARDRLFPTERPPVVEPAADPEAETPPVADVMAAAKEAIAAVATATTVPPEAARPRIASIPPVAASGELKPRVRAATARGPRVGTEPPIERSGEISPRPATASEPAAVVPALLISDLSSAHDAIARLAPTEHTRPPTDPVRVEGAAATVAVARQDATTAATVAFSAEEEEFFRLGTGPAPAPPAAPPPVESFPELDADYERVGFWRRLKGDTKPPE